MSDTVFSKQLMPETIYFHGNSVLKPGFDQLNIGTKVYFAEEEGEIRPQASTVRFVAPHLTGRVGAFDD